MPLGALVVNIAFLVPPELGAAVLTLRLGSVLLVGGVATRIVRGTGERHESRGWIIASAVITLLLRLLILFGGRHRPCG
ncbi:MAG TPA: hypothetical protein VKP10_19210 [Gemmatimonadales bacterium]|nr:hypothetical protein [Gemmatimonadales bacterium]